MLDRPDFQQALRYVFEEMIPFCRALDMKFKVVRGRAEVTLRKQDFMLGNTKLKVLHGGVTASVLDSIAGIAILMKMAEVDPKPDLETQLRALAAQLEQLQEQVRALGGRSGAVAPSTSVATNEPQNPVRPGRPPGETAPQRRDKTGFGSVVVSPDAGKKDEIGRLITEPGANSGGEVAGSQQQADPDADPKQMYSTAFGYWLQRDYGAAGAAFEDFLRLHANHPLAGNATYWMGESLYERGQYRAAASAYLKGYQTYGKSEKAPESLLKLAMSLQRLGQKDAACSSFNEFTTKFPNAPARVKSTAQTERQRVGC